jgi:predicted DNA-binding protein (MmcQ/YjbR family)
MASPEPVFRRIRALCLSLPEASEVAAWGHPNFKVRKKAFVSFETVQKRPSIAFRLDPTEVDALVEQGAFFATPYGRGLWASAWADHRVDARHLDRLALRSYRLVAGVRLASLLDQRRQPRRTPSS